jgi:predicted transcriptional regulator
MPKKGHTEEQIIAALKQYEGGEKAADICRKLGVSQASCSSGRAFGRV